MFPENLAEGETQIRGCEWSPAGDGAGGWGWLVTGTLMGIQEISAAHVVVGTWNFGPVAMAPLPWCSFLPV